ncbi:apolipoprotein N-acyltransferase [Beijerinckia mobilis]|uniref:apolipoprotein N-acyltransferase n=1 Tax=Beijerinckia mobilis TaxID=231434 RepID=UPI000551B911|nr:apolipoprotein N-acyltransferase [Beijerinckia mobilis]
MTSGGGLARLLALVLSVKGRRRALLAFLAGASGAAAMAPLNFWPGMVFAMSMGLLLVDGAAPPATATAAMRKTAYKRAFWIGWIWGFGYFLAGLWWLGAAFLVEAEDFAWALPLGVIGVPMGLALFPAFGFAFARFLWTPGPGRLFAFAAGLGASEWLRGHVLTGFPWNAYGMVLGGHLAPAQAAALIGGEGLTILTILLCAAPALSFPGNPWNGGARSRKALLTPLAAALCGVATLVGFGLLRLESHPTHYTEGVELAILQPNEQQGPSFSPENKDAIIGHYLALSQPVFDAARSDSKARLLIWPESAFPFILSRDRDALLRIGGHLTPDLWLATGAARLDTDDKERRYFNALQVIGEGGLIIDNYDKVHLVPFGEYLPLDGLLRRLGLHNFVHVPGGFTAGEARMRPLFVPNLPLAAPLICYEAIFPGTIVPIQVPSAERPGFMLNVTDDVWFGHTAGPYQHFEQARLRTIEEGLPLVRGANTGISAIVDPVGRIVASLPLGAEGLLRGPLPEPIAPPLYGRHPGLMPVLVWLFVLGVAYGLRPWRKRPLETMGA